MMNDMLSDMLKKMVPPEVLALLTAENIQQAKNEVESLISELREGMKTLHAQNANIIATLETLQNDKYNDSRPSAAGPKPIAIAVNNE